MSNSKIIKLRKGLNIKLEGDAEKIFIKNPLSETYAIKPTDFRAVIPKLDVQVNDEVLAGTPLFHDKNNPKINFVSPVSGRIEKINRGERRRIIEIIIRADKEIKYEQFEKIELDKITKSDLTNSLLKAGLWTFIRQKPFNIIANPDDEPKAIFISGFDSSPLAPDYDFILHDEKKSFQKGIDVLSKLVADKIHLGVNARFPISKLYSQLKRVEIHEFLGPHPAGNVGVQIHHINPINKGEKVWFVNPQDVVTIGRFIENGVYDASKIVALCGSEVLKSRYYKIINGASIKNIIKDNTTQNKLRFISGNVLTGTRITTNGYIGFYDSQITVIPEGDQYRFMGWATPGFKKYSNSRTFLSSLIPRKKYKLDANLNGEERAFVVSGQYEKVFPMNIFPVFLLKAILANDIEKMEKLGIYEVCEEDFALCEFVCSSKIKVQSIISRGIDMMIKETN
ncbi:MAG: NADH:ubiquinone reductase (Na(+)-transporting) subunit A [Bacteroidetes bacterium]|nr:MAG: NADH:ubiquinone reductase (Na(+)-transporting) subunit A [Bacteroidota bacterium]